MEGDVVKAIEVRRGRAGDAVDRVTLDFEARQLRRRLLRCDGGLEVMLDLPEVVRLEDGDALGLEDGRSVAVRAAPEPLIEVRGDLARLAWHIGNRHAPCEIAEDHLRVRRERVMRGMLEGLGAKLREIDAPFTPEGGAYAGHSAQSGGHAHTHGHAHAGHGHAPRSGAARTA